MHEMLHFRYYLLIGSEYVLIHATADYQYGTVGDLQAVKDGTAWNNAENYEKFGIGAMAGEAGW